MSVSQSVKEQLDWLVSHKTTDPYEILVLIWFQSFQMS
jgi:hypothetical protein